MRGYGRSSIYSAHGDYAIEHSVQDMLDLLVHLGRDRDAWPASSNGSSGKRGEHLLDPRSLSQPDLLRRVTAETAGA